MFKGPNQGPNPSHPSRPFMLLPHQFQRPSQPIPHSVGGVGPYANHFNARGEMVQHARPTASMVPPLPVCAFSFPSHPLLFFFVHCRTCSNESNRPPLRYDYARHQGATQSYSPNTTTPDDYASAANKLSFSSCHHRRLCYRRCSAHHHPHHSLRNRLSRVILALIW